MTQTFYLLSDFGSTTSRFYYPWVTSYDRDMIQHGYLRGNRQLENRNSLITAKTVSCHRLGFDYSRRSSETNEFQKRGVLDAIRVSDGAKVVMKRMPSDSNELWVACRLSSAEMLANPRNRTVPLLDIIHLPHDPDNILLVMPYLRLFHTPPFHCRGEFIEATRQLLQVRNLSATDQKYTHRDSQGLEFMHEHNISHGCMQFTPLSNILLMLNLEMRAYST